MSDQLVVQGDMIKLDPMFGPMLVNAPLAPIAAMVLTNIGSKAICVMGDEKMVQITGTYTKANFVTPGMGTAKIMGLAPNQPQPWLQVGSKPALCKGAQFQVLFTPMMPALDPSTGTPDPMAPAMGTGTFITTEVGVMAG